MQEDVDLLITVTKDKNVLYYIQSVSVFEMLIMANKMF